MAASQKRFVPETTHERLTGRLSERPSQPWKGHLNLLFALLCAGSLSATLPSPSPSTLAIALPATVCACERVSFTAPSSLQDPLCGTATLSHDPFALRLRHVKAFVRPPIPVYERNRRDDTHPRLCHRCLDCDYYRRRAVRFRKASNVANAPASIGFRVCFAALPTTHSFTTTTEQNYSLSFVPC